MRKIPVLMLACLMLCSCAGARLIDFTVISSKNVNLNLPAEAKGERVKGKVVLPIFFGTTFGSPSIKEATDRAIQKAGGEYDMLIDGVVRTRRNWFLLFGTRVYEVEGTPAKSSNIHKNTPQK